MAATEVRSGKLTSVRRECENMTTNWLHTRMCWLSPLASSRLRSGCSSVNCSNPSNSVAAGCRGPWRGQAVGGMPPVSQDTMSPFVWGISQLPERARRAVFQGTLGMAFVVMFEGEPQVGNGRTRIGFGHEGDVIALHGLHKRFGHSVALRRACRQGHTCWAPKPNSFTSSNISVRSSLAAPLRADAIFASS